MNVYMKEKTRVFCQNSFDDLDDNIGIVMPILTECDVDEDFTEGIEKVGDTIPILPLRNMVLFPGVALPVIIDTETGEKIKLGPFPSALFKCSQPFAKTRRNNSGRKLLNESWRQRS